MAVKVAKEVRVNPAFFHSQNITNDCDMKKNAWKTILKVVVAIATALLGVIGGATAMNSL